MRAPSVVFDTNFLISLFSRNLPAPIDLKTGQPIESFHEGFEHLLRSLQKDRIKILIPTPVLAEVLVREPQARQAHLKTLRRKQSIRIVPFDVKAAVELASMTREASERDNKFSASSQSRQKVKFDRQIVAIAKVQEAGVIYSDDKKLRKFAETADLRVISQQELPQPSQFNLI